MTAPEPELIRCPESGCRWTRAGIPDDDTGLRARVAAQHAVDVHVASGWDVTEDVHAVLDRLVLLLESRVHQPCGSRGTRYLIRRAVYGGLWSVERIGDVPEEDRPRLRALAAHVTRLVIPGGIHARAVSAADIRAMAEANVADTTAP